MKEWEKLVIESKNNLWLITTKCQQLLCTNENGIFFIKSPIRLTVRPNYILKAVKL